MVVPLLIIIPSTVAEFAVVEAAAGAVGSRAEVDACSTSTAVASAFSFSTII